MFYDRTKIEPDNKIEISSSSKKLVFTASQSPSHASISLYAPLIVSNSGRRPAVITKVEMYLSYNLEGKSKEVYDCMRWRITNSLQLLGKEAGEFPAPFIIGPNNTVTCDLSFEKKLDASKKDIASNLKSIYNSLESYDFIIAVYTINEDVFSSENIHYEK